MVAPTTGESDGTVGMTGSVGMTGTVGMTGGVTGGGIGGSRSGGGGV